MRLIHSNAEIRVNAGTNGDSDSVITDRRNPATLADGQYKRSEMFKNGVVALAHRRKYILPRHLNGLICPIKSNCQQITSWFDYSARSKRAQLAFPAQAIEDCYSNPAFSKLI